jgi:hypothetical protein
VAGFDIDAVDPSCSVTRLVAMSGVTLHTFCSLMALSAQKDFHFYIRLKLRTF